MSKDYRDIEGLVKNSALLLETAYDRGAKERQQATIPDIIESVKIEICDKYCKYPYKDGISEETLQEICENCPLSRLG